MRDGEAFAGFLGGRIRRLLFGGDVDQYGPSDLPLFRFRGETLRLEEAVYKYYRSTLVHEGGLPLEAEFTEKNPTPQLTVGIRGAKLGVSMTDDRLTLDHGLLPILAEVVSGADCNAVAYGRELYSVKPKATLDEAKFKTDIVSKYSISSGRFDVLKRVLYFLDPGAISAATDAKLCELFEGVVETPEGPLNGGAITGLASRGLTDFEGNLLPKGIEVLRRIAEKYERVRIP